MDNADYSRYILREEYREAKPFIQAENAQFNITFSCVSYLNTALILLPIHTTDQERAALVVRGFYGLQLYANQFWYKHLLAYCALWEKKQTQFPDELLMQLDLLVRYLKDNRPEGESERSSILAKLCVLEGNEGLHHVPHVRDLIANVISFRAALSQDDLANKAPERRLIGTDEYCR
jgi:hypothetical protein